MSIRLKPYPEYKESGVPWLGKIPKNWYTSPIKALATVSLSSVDKLSKTEEIEVRFLGTNTVYNKATITNSIKLETVTASAAEIRRFSLLPDDVVLTKDSVVPTNIAIPAYVPEHLENIICGYHLALIRPRKDKLRGDFLFWLLSSRQLNEYFLSASTGTTIIGIGKGTISSAYIVFPPLEEQSLIATYLDQVDRRINRIIRVKKRLIGLLNEQKQAIIHGVVMRGLNPNVRLKPSGVDWLDDVPEHWEVKRLKHLATHITSGSRGWSNYAADSGPLFIRIGNLTRNSIELNLSDVVRLNLPKLVMGETTRTRVAPDDILLSITAFIGSVAVVPADIGEAYVSQHVACCRVPHGAANTRWLGYVLLSPIGKTHGSLCMYGGTKQGLSLDDVKNYVVLLPPRDEQDLLVHHIEAESASINVAIARTQREIQLIQEYRTRLIADVVSGKLDVRNVKLSTVDEIETQNERLLDDAIEEGEELEAVEEGAYANN